MFRPARPSYRMVNPPWGLPSTRSSSSLWRRPRAGGLARPGEPIATSPSTSVRSGPWPGGGRKCRQWPSGLRGHGSPLRAEPLGQAPPGQVEAELEHDALKNLAVIPPPSTSSRRRQRCDPPRVGDRSVPVEASATREAHDGRDESPAGRSIVPSAGLRHRPGAVPSVRQGRNRRPAPDPLHPARRRHLRPQPMHRPVQPGHRPQWGTPGQFPPLLYCLLPVGCECVGRGRVDGQDGVDSGQGAGGSFALAGIPDRLMRLLTLTGLDTVLPLHPTTAEALAAHRQET